MSAPAPASSSPSGAPSLRDLTDAIQQRPGVQGVVIVGADGLVIETHDASHDHADAVAARVPGVVTAARQLGDAAEEGELQLALLEFDAGFGIVLRLTPHAMLFVATSRDVALSELLFDLRRHRAPMAALV
jgi:predicted regulator of Ras-like GTPase activity (Roadblock/LC7/MglB family)